MSVLQLLVFLFLCASVHGYSFPYQDPTQPNEGRARDLLSRLTLSEKVLLMTTNPYPIPRLELPPFGWGQECLHGVFNILRDGSHDGAITMFPAPIGLAAAFNASMIYAMGQVISDEALALRNYHRLRNESASFPDYRTCWAPFVNIVRDPRWGRVPETYGEDPYLTSTLGLEYVRSIQGSDKRYIKMAAVPKTLAAYNGPESGRMSFNAVVSDIDLHDEYTSVFKRLVVEGNAKGIMVSYTAINGVPSAANPYLLTSLLRSDWGFTGHVVCDCDACGGIYLDHHYTKTMEEGVAAAVLAGTDLDCGDSYNHLADAEAMGLIKEADIDRSLFRLINLQMELGVFDPVGLSPYDSIPHSVIDSPSHRAMSLSAAEQSMVLLKNSLLYDDDIVMIDEDDDDNDDFANTSANVLSSSSSSSSSTGRPTLPLDLSSLSNIAIIGPSANDTAEWANCFKGPGCLLLHTYKGIPPFVVNPYMGVKAYVEKKMIESKGSVNVNVTYAPGMPCRYCSSTALFNDALSIARSADAVVVFIGLEPDHEEEDSDRGDLGMPGVQTQLVQEIVSVVRGGERERQTKRRVPVIVVLINGAPIAARWEEDNVDAILEAFYPGQSAGDAIANILFGDVSPSGRLPYTVHTSVAQLPPITEFNMSKAPGRTYRFFTGEPLYHFGYGLTYTTFKYFNAQASLVAGVLSVSVGVSNIGGRSGATVAQLYIAFDDMFKGREPYATSLNIPRLQLCGFSKHMLSPSESRLLTFDSVDLVASVTGFSRLITELLTQQPPQTQLFLFVAVGDGQPTKKSLDDSLVVTLTIPVNLPIS